MSAKSLFVPSTHPDADGYTPIPYRFKEIPCGKKNAAWLVWSVMVFRCNGDRVWRTDKDIQADIWAIFSPSGEEGAAMKVGLRFIQKGLKALEDVGIIKRDDRRRHGPIVILVRLKGSAGNRPRIAPSTLPNAARAKDQPIPNVGYVTPVTAAEAAAAKRLNETLGLPQAPVDARPASSPTARSGP